MNEAILDKLMQLTLAERLDIANKLRDSIGADQSEIVDDDAPLSEAQMREVQLAGKPTQGAPAVIGTHHLQDGDFRAHVLVQLRVDAPLLNALQRILLASDVVLDKEHGACGDPRGMHAPFHFLND